MLVYKDGSDKKDILGFRCDLCDHFTLTDVIPNKHGEFHYICPKCKHHMKEVPEKKEEETKMVNTYTVSNAAKRLNCSVATIQRAITDGRFHDCFMEAGYHGRPAWMIPSDQVEEWVSKGGFLQMGKKYEGTKNEDEKPVAGRYPWGKDDQVRMVFDPTVGKDVPVLDLLGDKKKEQNEFEKRVVRRVNNKPKSEPKYVKVLDRTENLAGGHPWGDLVTAVPLGGDTDGDTTIANMKTIQQMQDEIDHDMMAKQHFSPVDGNDDVDHLEDTYRYGAFRDIVDANVKALRSIDMPVNPGPVVRTDNGFSITFPTEMIESMVHDQIKKELSEKVAQLRAALDLMNEELKKLEEAIV